MRYTIDVVKDSAISEPGNYILFEAGRFTAPRILDPDCYMIGFSHRSHEQMEVNPSEFDIAQYEAVMRVTSGTCTSSCGRDFLGGAVPLQHQ